jgi:RNA-binding protein 25
MNWKRVEGPSGKLQAFGFCEYDNPQSTLRCIRLLNGYEIAEKKLLVKVDQKTRELLGEYIKKKDDKAPLTKNAKKAAMLRNYPSSNNRNRSAEDGELDEDESNNEKNINLELVDEDTLKEDRIVLNALEMILRQYQKDLVPAPPLQPAPSTTEAIIPTSTPPLSTTANLTTTTTTTSTAVAIKPANSDAKVSTPLSVSSNESKDNKLKVIIRLFK